MLLGTVIGVLPGLGPPATIAMLLPLTFGMQPAGAMIMLAGIYYGAKYGGSTTSILMNVPGESASVITCLDGYQMARNGRAGAALGLAAIASFVAGTVGVVGLMLVAPPLAKLSLAFSSPEYFALMAFGLSMVVLLAGASLVKALLSMLVGLWIAGIGTDLFSATSRFTFGRAELLGGIDFTIVAIGIFAIGEVLVDRASRRAAGSCCRCRADCATCCRRAQDLKDSRFAFANGSIVGFLVGVLPGAGSTIASLLSYGIEKSVSKRPEAFGTGVPEGVAAPEGANNAETGGALVPLLTLGIPGSATTAMLLAALILWGFRPGSAVPRRAAGAVLGTGREHVHRQPDAARAESAARPAVRAAAAASRARAAAADHGRVDRRRDDGLADAVRGPAARGLRAPRLAMRRLDYPAAPLVLGLVLGDPMERALRQSLMMSQGDLSILVSRPISATILVLAALVLVVPLTRRLNALRLQAIES